LVTTFVAKPFENRCFHKIATLFKNWHFMNSHALRVKNISIRNFRSIVEANQIELDDLNVIVGNNDQGKSNILRALNLFFNHSRQIGATKYNFQQYFCLFAKKIKKKADEIVIELTIQPPIYIRYRATCKMEKSLAC
jgi:predicted ATP-dependent endonuclease of OLD family